jgi:hypothetical protein
MKQSYLNKPLPGNAMRLAFVSLLLLIFMGGSLLFILPALAHNMSSNGNVASSGVQKPPRANCHVVLAHGMQPCVKHVYPWSLDDAHPSPRVLLGPDWTLSYICDGGPGNLDINGRFIQSLVCDNAWHSMSFGRGGFVQVAVDRAADVTVIG